MMDAAAEMTERHGYTMNEPVKCETAEQYRSLTKRKGAKDEWREAQTKGQEVYFVSADGPRGRLATTMKVSLELAADKSFDLTGFLRKDGAQSLLYRLSDPGSALTA